MQEVFATVYEALGFYSDDLASHLAGMGVDCDYSGIVYYNVIGFATLALAFLGSLIYYKVIDRPKFNNRFAWSMGMLAVGLIAMLGAFIPVNIDVQIDDVCTDLDVGVFDVFMFSLMNGIVAMLWYFIASLVLRYLSTNCRTTPF